MKMSVKNIMLPTQIIGVTVWVMSEFEFKIYID